MAHGLKISEDLSSQELRIEARRAETARAAARMYAIANALEGKNRAEAARLAGMDRQALRDAVVRYNAEGLDGLSDRDRPGRPRHLSKQQEIRLTKLILRGPDPEKDGISAYTLEDLARIAKKRFGATYHPTSMSRVLRRLGFSRQKARPSHPKKNPASQEAFKKSSKNAEKNCSYT
jgi:transposase